MVGETTTHFTRDEMGAKGRQQENRKKTKDKENNKKEKNMPRNLLHSHAEV